MEVVCVLIIALFGTLGNLLVIFSVIFDGRVNQHGNIFAINLAVADLFVSHLANFFCLLNCLKKWSNIVYHNIWFQKLF